MMLIEAGADIKVHNRYQLSPMKIAKMKQSHEILMAMNAVNL